MQTPPTLQGKVIHGKALGRTIGFPTANVELDPAVIVEEGTYEVSGTIFGKTFHGVGAKKSDPFFEAHFFEFSEDIYDETIEVTLISKIRENRKFESFEALKEQIAKDVAFVKEKMTQ